MNSNLLTKSWIVWHSRDSQSGYRRVRVAISHRRLQTEVKCRGQRVATERVNLFRRKSWVFWWRWVNFYILGAPNYRFSRHSRTGKWYPRATTSPKPREWLSSWRNISHRGQFRQRWCSTTLAREGGGSVSVRLFVAYRIFRVLR